LQKYVINPLKTNALQRFTFLLTFDFQNFKIEVVGINDGILIWNRSQPEFNVLIEKVAAIFAEIAKQMDY
jgi:hypothetical protein